MDDGVAGFIGDAIGIDAGHLAAGAYVDAEPFELLARALRERGHEAAEDAVGAFQQHDAGLRRVDASELLRQRVVRDFGHRAGHLDTGRPGADHDEGHPWFALCGARAALGVLESADHARSDRERIGERLQPRRVHGPVVVAEVAVRGTGGDDEMVVGQRLVFVEQHAARGHVEADDFGLQDRQVAAPHLAAQRVADRCAHRRRAHAGGRDLVQQRLEQVVVGAVHERDFDIGLRQRAHRFEAAEAGADDHHPGAARAHSLPSAPPAALPMPPPASAAWRSRLPTISMWLRSAYSSSV